MLYKIIGEGKIEFEDIIEFSRKTHEALFLYDERVSEYLRFLIKKASRLRYLGKVIKSQFLAKDHNRELLLDEESEIIGWFSENIQVGRKLFKQYLHLG